MAASVRDFSAEPGRNEGSAKTAQSHQPVQTPQASAANEAAEPTQPGSAAAAGGNATAKESKVGADGASRPKDLPASSGGDKNGESSATKELLPNGIPKVVFDVQPAASAASSDACGASKGFAVSLDAADSHLDLQIDKNCPLKASCMSTGGFQYLWKGVRATHGVKGKGIFYFEVKVGPKPPSVVMPDTPANTQHVCRVGVSQPLTSLHLGDSAESWGFGGTGKKSTNRKFLDYGEAFEDGDVVGVVIDLDFLTLAFTKNGKFLGTAFELPQKVRNCGLFPHVYVKNFYFEINFRRDTKWFDPPGEGVFFMGDLKEQDLLLNPVEHPKSVSECEFIMMCGLPACGKTYWAERHMERNAAKSYVLLGTNAVIDQMKIMGLKRQANYATRWEELMTTANEVFNSLVSYAGSGAVFRNIIIDQTNVFKRARSRKAQPFQAWGTRRCVVMVTDERILQQRTQKREREEGKIVPVSAVMDMKAAFALPSLEEGFSAIDYVEMPERESRQEIRRINDEGRAFKANNPDLNRRQPKPHIEARAASGEAAEWPAKRHKADQWQDRRARHQQCWGAGEFQEGRGYCGGQGQQQLWKSADPQGGWQQQQQGAWHSSSSPGTRNSYQLPSGCGFRYGRQGADMQGGPFAYPGLQYTQQQQGYGGGYDGNQQASGRADAAGCCYNSQGGAYDSRYAQGGRQQQHWQQHYGGQGSQYAGGGGERQQNSASQRGSASYNNCYYSNQGRY